MSEEEARGPGQPLGRVAGKPHVGHAVADAVDQAVPQHGQALGLRVHVTAPYLRCLAEADDTRYVLRARPAPPLVLAAVLDRDHASALADPEAGDALGSVDLVTREGQRVDPEGVEVDGDLAKGLDSVDVERDPMLARDATDRRDRLKRPHLAVGVHDADGDRVGSDGAADVVRIDYPILVNADVGDVESLRLERLARSEHGVVLDARCDEVPLAASVRQPLHPEVVRLRPARGEHDFLRRDAQEARHALARALDAFPRVAAERVDAGGVPEDLREVREHLGKDLGVDRGRRVVIEVHATVHSVALHFSRCYARLAMDLTKKRLGVLLSTGLEHPNLETAVALTQTALDRGADVYLYLIDEGRRCSCARTAARSAGSRCATPTASPTVVWSCSPTCSTAPSASSRSTDVSGGAGVSGEAGSVPDTAPVVVLISADPRRSHRANEAMRIGLGVVAGENDVTFVLTGPGVHLLDADTDELVDGDDIARFRANLRALGIPFHVEADAIPSDTDWNADRHEVVPITRERIAELVRQGRRFLAF